MRFIVDDIEEVVIAMRDQIDGPPYFDYGHPVELVNNLKMKNQDADLKEKKYPLIYVRTDIEEELKSGVWDEKLTIFIIDYTNLNYTSRERKEQVFKPILYPLYEDFIDGLKKSGLFALGNNMQRPDHKKIDRFFWGSQYNYNNTANVLEDPLDAIEISNLRLKQFTRQIC